MAVTSCSESQSIDHRLIEHWCLTYCKMSHVMSQAAIQDVEYSPSIRTDCRTMRFKSMGESFGANRATCECQHNSRTLSFVQDTDLPDKLPNSREFDREILRETKLTRVLCS